MKVRICLAAAVAIFAMTALLHAADRPAGKSWTFVGFTKYRDAVYLDPDRLARKSPEEFLAVCRIAPSAKSRYLRQIQTEFRKVKKSSAGFRYVEISAGIQCRNKTIRFVGVKYFTADGRLLHSHEEPGAPWSPIASGSLWDSLRGSVCGKGPF
ncbi:MAG: hypothetical protein RBT20_15265 [Syntrophales bacterium]|jgi:hypothetical protein|nr:hypothetical protein [Syntrophales bacterium]